ncbi:MAG: hypothetical protein ABIO02_04335 [Patescibacteria group bacterium]
MMKNGKVSIEEPTILSTYSVSAKGQEMITIGPKYFIRNEATKTWTEGMLLDYFAEQEIKDAEFPIQGYDTQAVSPQGIEIITKNATLMMKTDPAAKQWQVSTLAEYFKDNTVINALPDSQDEQLPVLKLKTHAYTPDGVEVVTFKDRFWTRKIDGDQWATGELTEYFTDQTIEEGTLPTTYWDNHIFTKNGREMIIVGETLWFREPQTTSWKQQSLKEYFGSDFPLESEVQAKQKVDAEMDEKQFEVLKNKVMNELRKFFKPELINRFDEVILFEPLKFSDMTAIAKLQLKGVAKLLEEQEMGFSCTDAAIKEIVHSGFDPLFGARPLRRAIQKLVENPVSSLIIEQKLKPGDSVQADFDGTNFIFNIEHVTLVPQGSAAPIKGAVEEFSCTKCQTQFKTEVLPTATVICKNCASSQVTHPSAVPAIFPVSQASAVAPSVTAQPA